MATLGSSPTYRQDGRVCFPPHLQYGPQYSSNNPEASRIFDHAIELTAEVPFDRQGLRLLGVNTTVDVGGGNGGLITDILGANAGMKGVVADLPHVFEGAKKHVRNAGLADRCDCVSIDMLQKIPAGADAYIMANVVHDWDDERCISILKNCRRAMDPDGRVLLELLLTGRQTALRTRLSGFA